MKKIFLLFAICFVVKISYSQSNQPFYVMPTFSSVFKQTIAAGSLVLTKDSCNSYFTTTMGAIGGSILSTPKYYAFPNSQSGNYYMVNRKLNGSATHTLGSLFLDGTKLWQQGMVSNGTSATTTMQMTYNPNVLINNSNGFIVNTDSVVMRAISRLSAYKANKIKITADSLWIAMNSNLATRWDNLGNIVQYKDLTVHGHAYLDDLNLDSLYVDYFNNSGKTFLNDSLIVNGGVQLLKTNTLGSSADSLLCKNSITNKIELRPQPMVVPLTNTLVVDGNRTDTYIPNGSTSRPYKNIQQAIDTAAVYATDVSRYVITINPSVYVEDIAMKQYIGLRGADIEATIIQGTVTWDLSNRDLSGSEIAVLTVQQYNAPAIICEANENAYVGVRSCYLTCTWDNDAAVKYVIKTLSGYLELYGQTYVENFVTNSGNGAPHVSCLYYDSGVLGSDLDMKLFSLSSSHNFQVQDTTDDVCVFYSTKDNTSTDALIKDGNMNITLTEIMTLDVPPVTAWETDDVIVGQSSGTTCVIVDYLTPTTYRVRDRDGLFTSGETIGIAGNLANQGVGYPTFGNLHNQKVAIAIHNQSKGFTIMDNDYALVSAPYTNNISAYLGIVNNSYSPNSKVVLSNGNMEVPFINPLKSYWGASYTQYDELDVNYCQISSVSGLYPQRDVSLGSAGLYQVIGTTNDDIDVGGRLTASKLVCQKSFIGRGAISVGAGGTSVTGYNSTVFLDDFVVGDTIISEGQTKIVVSIFDDSHMTTTAWGAAINVKGYTVKGGVSFESNPNGNTYINQRAYINKAFVNDSLYGNGVTDLQKTIINDSLIVHGNTKITGTVSADTTKINAIKFSNNSIQITAGYTSVDTSTVLATKWDVSQKENPLTFIQPLQRFGNTVSLNDTIAQNMTFLGKIKVNGNITADTAKVSAVKFADNSVQDTKGIPLPVSATSGQILSFNGSQWIPINNAAPISAGAPSILFYEDSASNIPTYESLWSHPLGQVEQIESVSVNADTVLIDAYATDSVGLGLTVFNAGVWQFNTFAKVNDTTGLSEIVYKVYFRQGNIETFMFKTSTVKLVSTTVFPYSTTYVDVSHAVTPTTRLVVKVYGTTAIASNRTVSFYHGGTTHYSNIITPFPTLHNSLGGLQGGQANQYYHLTKAQDSIVTQTANGTRDGYLTSANWTTFNNKLSPTDTLTSIATQYDISLKANKSTTISSGTGLTGGGDLSANRTISADSTAWIATDYSVSLKVPKTTTISTTSPLTGGGALSGNLTLGIPVATNVVNGYLSSTDFSTFSGKESPLTFSTGLTRTLNTVTSNLSTGVTGGQTVVGGTSLGNNLTLSSTTNATKGKIIFGNSYYDELNNRLGIGVASPTALLELASGTITANTAPLKFNSGLNLSTPESGAVEFDGTYFYLTIGSNRSIIALFSDTASTFATKTWVSTRGYLTSANLAIKADTSTKISAGTFLTGGGSLRINRTLNVDSTKYATASNSGFLKYSDWTVFNNKVPTLRTITAGAGLSGGGDLSSNRTISADTTTTLASKTWVGTRGYVTTARTISTGWGLSGGGDLSANRTLLADSTKYATATNSGFLKYSDWKTFNSKENALTFSTGLTRNTNTITNNLSTGVSGGQTAIGGTAASDNLTLSSTSNATKGSIILGTSYYSEVNNSFGIGITTPTAALHLKQGTATANTAPLKFTSGTNLGTPEVGAVEYNGTDLFVTDNIPVRQEVVQSAYGDMYENGAGTVITLTTANSWYGWQTATNNVNQLLSFLNNTAVTVPNITTVDQKSILSGGAGVYTVTVSGDVVLSATAQLFTCAVFKNNVIQPNLQCKMNQNNAANYATISISGLVTGVVTGDVFDVRFTAATNTRTVTVYNLSLVLTRNGR